MTTSVLLALEGRVDPYVALTNGDFDVEEYFGERVYCPKGEWLAVFDDDEIAVQAGDPEEAARIALDMYLYGSEPARESYVVGIYRLGIDEDLEVHRLYWCTVEVPGRADGEAGG